MSRQKDEASAPRPGEAASTDAPSHLPPDLQQANVSNAKKVEEDVVEPIQQYREGRRQPRRKSSTSSTPKQ
jgi:hypothetical protein